MCTEACNAQSNKGSVTKNFTSLLIIRNQSITEHIVASILGFQKCKVCEFGIHSKYNLNVILSQTSTLNFYSSSM